MLIPLDHWLPVYSFVFKPFESPVIWSSQTIFQNNIVFQAVNGSVKATVLKANVIAANGIIHIVDRMLENIPLIAVRNTVSLFSRICNYNNILTKLDHCHCFKLKDNFWLLCIW